MSDIADEILDDLEDGKPNETKAEKFKRLGSQRTVKILKLLKQLKNLSSSAYEYTTEDVDKIFGAIRAQLDETEQAFKKGKKSETEFSL